MQSYGKPGVGQELSVLKERSSHSAFYGSSPKISGGWHIHGLLWVIALA
jgi:hypothetical protein